MNHAAAPDIRSRDRLQIGRVTVHRIADIDRIAWPVTAIFRDFAGEALREAAGRYPGAVDAAAGTLTLSFNSYVIDAPDFLCLVDAGIGNGKDRPDRPVWHRRNGDFMRRLRALGFAPERFDLVVNTHLHADHVGWNTTQHGEGWQPTFKNARYVVPSDELDHWRALYQHDSHILHGAFADSIQPILDENLYRAVELPCEIAPNLWLDPAPGHTRGMAVVRLKVGDTEMLFLADVMHSPLQLAAPALTSNFCVDPVQAGTTRVELLNACAGTGTIVAAYHFPPPVFGRIAKEGPGYLFTPMTA